MLSNAYFLAKFRFDTAENEPGKNMQKICKNLLILLTVIPRKSQGIFSTRCTEQEILDARAGNITHQRELARKPARGHLLYPRFRDAGTGRAPRARYLRLGVRVSKIGKISKILQIFGGLVLGCIKTKFCKKICV